MLVRLADPIEVHFEAIVEYLNSNLFYLWSREGLDEEVVQLREAS